MRSRTIQWLAILLIIQTGLFHYLTAQVEYEEAAYMGYLFMANLLGSLIAAFGIYHKQKWGWTLGLIVTAGSILGYIWSRTLGMPGMLAEEWFSPYGLMSMTIEGLFILLYFTRPWKAVAAEDSNPVSNLLRYGLPIGSLFIMASISFATYQWDKSVNADVGDHVHVGTYAEVCNTPVLSFNELEEKYGVQVSLVAISVMDTVVDVRLKIIDPAKAHALLNNQAAILVDTKTLILAPHLHNHHALKTGKQYLMFFSTQRNTVKRGSEVSLVFGSVRIQPVMAK